MSPLEQGRQLIRWAQWMVMAYALIVLLRMGLAPGDGVLSRKPWTLLVYLGLGVALLLPWARWAKSTRAAQIHCWGACVAIALLAVASGWAAGFSTWWNRPLAMSLFAPALLSLELNDPVETRTRALWRLNRAQAWAVGTWVGLWVVLWWATLSGPGAEPREAFWVHRLTWMSWTVTAVWFILLKAQRLGLPMGEARWAVIATILLVHLPFKLFGNSADPWINSLSGHPPEAPTSLWSWSVVIALAALIWKARQAPRLLPAAPVMLIAWLSSNPLNIPTGAAMQLPLMAVAWVLLVPPRWWPLALLGWAASWAWFGLAPNTLTTTVIQIGLTANAVGVLTHLMLRRLRADDVASTDAEQAAAGTPDKPAAPDWVTLSPTQSRLATAAGWGVGLATPLIGYAAASHTSVPYLQALSLLGLLLGYLSYTGVRFWLERESRGKAQAEFEQLRVVLDTAKTAFRLYTAQGQALWVNLMALRTGHQTLDEALAINLFELPFYKLAGLADAARRALADGTEQQLNYRGLGSAGQAVDVSWVVNRVVLGGQACLLIQGLDLSKEHAQQAQLEQALAQSQGLSQQLQGALTQSQTLSEQLQTERDRLQAQGADLAQALKDAQAANLAKQQFVSTISHEIRTPLNGIMGGLEMLRLQDLPPASRNFVDLTTNASQVLLRMMSDMLDLAQIEAGQLKLEPTPLRLDVMVEQVGQILQMAPRDAGVTLSVGCSPALQAPVLADDVRLRQVLLNLGNNALKFTHHGQVRLWAEPLASEPGHQGLRITVQDSGIGMGPDMLAQLFTPFKQADGGHKRKYGGTGLGLSIVKQLLEAMGGSITVDSTQGQGSTFTVTLLLALAPTEPAEPAQLPATQPATRTQSLPLPPQPAPPTLDGGAERAAGQEMLAGRHYLVVDDMAVNRQVLCALLHKLGATTHQAESGQQALDRLSQTDQLPDAVFMDIQMPVLNGLEASQAIRQHPKAALQALPVIAVTGATGSEITAEAHAAGMNHFLQKPVSLRAVLGVLRACAAL
jgi:signal transduction histidine kinase/CheY-like chemotaxis protein